MTDAGKNLAYYDTDLITALKSFFGDDKMNQRFFGAT